MGQTESRRLIRTVAGAVAELISRKEVGPRPISVRPEKPIFPGLFKVSSQVRRLPDTDSRDIRAGSSEMWTQMKHPACNPGGGGGGCLLSAALVYNLTRETKLLQVSLELGHMDVRHVAAFCHESHNVMFSPHTWFIPIMSTFVLWKNKIEQKKRKKEVEATRLHNHLWE